MFNALLILAFSSIGLLGWLLLSIFNNPEKAEIIGGWFYRGLAFFWRKYDRAAVARGVQGEVNSGRSRLLRDAPSDLLEGKLRVKWTDVDEARAALEGGEVVVFMRDSGHKEQNVATAVMAYLPRAVLPRARPYVDRRIMKAVDLMLAKSLLSDRVTAPGALDVFYEEHFDPARETDSELRDRVTELDQIDLHGWLTRVLLAEYRRMGSELYPGNPDDTCREDAVAFAKWLHDIANADPDTSPSLDYRGAYLRVSMMKVALRGKVLAEGLEPYRKRAKRLIYQDRVDALYLVGRDQSIETVRELVAALRTDGRVATVREHVYRLRSDFRARILNRERAICACLIRRDVSDGDDSDSSATDFETLIREDGSTDEAAH